MTSSNANGEADAELDDAVQSIRAVHEDASPRGSMGETLAPEDSGSEDSGSAGSGREDSGREGTGDTAGGAVGNPDE